MGTARRLDSIRPKMRRTQYCQAMNSRRYVSHDQRRDIEMADSQFSATRKG